MATVDDRWSEQRRAAELRDQGYPEQHILRVTGCDVRLLADEPDWGSSDDPESPGDREKAREMRRAGGSLQQVASAFGISISTAYNWTFDVVDQRPTDARKRRQVTIDEARRMRHDGSSYKQIARTLGISPATAHGWTRDVPLREGVPEPRGRAAEELRDLNRQRWAAQRRVHERERRLVHDRAVADTGELVDRDLLLLGAVAYWCEGGKAKPWAPHREQVRFINSDPALVRLFLRFLVVAGVEPERVQYRLSIHETADVVVATEYWSEVVGVPPEVFLAPTLKRHKPLTPRRNTGDHYRGCLSVYVLDGRRLYWRIDALMAALDAAVRGENGEPARKPLC